MNSPVFVQTQEIVENRLFEVIPVTIILRRWANNIML